MSSAEVIYEVNLAIKAEIRDDYLAWLKPHIQQILAIRGFIRAEILTDADKDLADPAHKHVVVQYRVKDQESLQNYFDHHAAEMRQDGKTRFGENFSATRRVLATHQNF